MRKGDQHLRISNQREIRTLQIRHVAESFFRPLRPSDRLRAAIEPLSRVPRPGLGATRRYADSQAFASGAPIPETQPDSPAMTNPDSGVKRRENSRAPVKFPPPPTVPPIERRSALPQVGRVARFNLSARPPYHPLPCRVYPPKNSHARGQPTRMALATAPTTHTAVSSQAES